MQRVREIELLLDTRAGWFAGFDGWKPGRSPQRAVVGNATAVERVIEAGRIRPQEPTPAATQILSATHGFVLLAISGFIDSQGVQDVMAQLAVNLMVGFGDTRRRAERSLAAAIKARASQHQNKSRSRVV